MDHGWKEVESRIGTLHSLTEQSVRDGSVQDGTITFYFAPLVAQLMVRHPEFGTGSFGVHMSAEYGLGLPRTGSMHEYAGLLSQRRWVILRTEGAFVTSDLGFAGIATETTEGTITGIVAPVGRHLSLLVERWPLLDAGRRITPSTRHAIEVRNLSDAHTREVNTVIADWAPQAVYAGDPTDVDESVRAKIENSAAFGEPLAPLLLHPLLIQSGQADRLRPVVANDWLRWCVRHAQPVFGAIAPILLGPNAFGAFPVAELLSRNAELIDSIGYPAARLVSDPAGLTGFVPRDSD